MPIHDWTRVEAGTFHAFHFFWIGTLCHRLNHGGLPRGFFALPEQHVPGPEADILALETRPKTARKRAGGGTAVIETPPRTRIVESTERYAKKANRIAIRHEEGHVVAFIEIVSPGNKRSRQGLRAFVDKATQLLDQGVHLLIIDLLPPTRRDPQGIHRAIWEEIHETKFKLPANKPLTLVAYSAGLMTRAFIEPIAVGDVLPEMPLFLEPDRHVLTPLEATYQAAFAELPEDIRERLD
jgi:hypothetical protein